MSKLDINSRKTHKYFMSLTVAEQLLTKHVIETVITINKIMALYKVSKNDICERCGVPFIQQDAFIKGAFNYSLEHLSKLQCYADELQQNLTS